MQISRLLGITSNILLNNSLQTIRMKGSNSSLGEFASGSINDNSIPTINSNTGMFLVILDENLNRLDTKRYTLTSNASSGRTDLDFISYMGSLQPRRYFILVSNGSIGHSNAVDDFFTDYLGGALWNDMWGSYNSLYSSPQTTGNVSYAAFGSSALGITHEAFNITDTAEIFVNIRNYDDFCITGYGLPLVELESNEYSTTYTDINIPLSQNIRGIYINVRYKNATSEDDIVLVKTYNDNSTTTLSLNTRLGALNKNVTLNSIIEQDLDSAVLRVRNVDISHGEVFKSNYGEITNPVSSISKKGKGFSVLDMAFSMNGYDFENSNHLENFSNDSNVFSSMSSTSLVDNISMPSESIINSVLSEAIEVNPNQDYFLGFFSKNQTSNNTNITVYVQGLDSDMNQLETVSFKGQTTSFLINLGEYSHPSDDPVYQEYYILSQKQSLSDISNSEYLMSGVYGNYQYGGLSANTNIINDLCVMIPEVAYLRFEFVADNQVEIISPVCGAIKYSITKYSKYLGNITES